MHSKTAMTSAIVSTVVLVALGFPRSAPAKSGCSSATLRGRYGIEAAGTVASGPLAGPIAIVGVLTYDGIGAISGNLTQRVTTATGPITLSKVPYAGTYIVNADCTVEDSITNLSNGTSSTHETIIVDGGRGFVILNTTTGPTVVIGRGRKQFPASDDPDE